MATLLNTFSSWIGPLNYHRQGHRRCFLLKLVLGNYQSVAHNGLSLWRYKQLSKLVLIESATLRASLSRVFNWSQWRSHNLGSIWLYLAPISALSNVSCTAVKQKSAISRQGKTIHFCVIWWKSKRNISVICFSSLVFRVGYNHKQQAAQWARDFIPAGENPEDGRKCWREIPSVWYPDVWWENRMGKSQRRSNKRSELKGFSSLCQPIKPMAHHFLAFYKSEDKIVCWWRNLRPESVQW